MSILPRTVPAFTLMELSATGFIMGLIVTFLIIPRIAGYMRRKGMVGIDIHKLSHPKIPEMIGLAIVLGTLTSVVVVTTLWQDYFHVYISFTFTVIIAAIIGAIDDLKGLGPRSKPLLMTLSSIPILLLGTYSPYPVLPFVGVTRFTIVYPLLVPIAVAVTSNAMNMADPVNGAMSGSSMIILVALLISSVLLGRENGIILSALMLGPVLAFYWYNRYPSKVFSGDIGSLFVGAALGAIVVIGRLEVVGVVAMMPQIINAFYILSSVGRLFEHSTIQERPVRILPDGRLDANLRPGAPVTLTRIILAGTPMSEDKVAREFFLLNLLSAFLAVITAISIKGEG